MHINKFTNMSRVSLSHLYSSGEFLKKVSVREGCSLVWSLITMWVFFSQIGFQFISVQCLIQVGSWIISIKVIISQSYLLSYFFFFLFFFENQPWWVGNLWSSLNWDHHYPREDVTYLLRSLMTKRNRQSNNHRIRCELHTKIV